MKKSLFADVYPIQTREIAKSSRYPDVSSVVTELLQRIKGHPKATAIAVFDHLAHTRSIGGEVGEGILAAGNVVFCFGARLPGAEVLALRPRSIGLAEYADRFVVTFMEAPVAEANLTMTAWVNELAQTPQEN